MWYLITQHYKAMKHIAYCKSEQWCCQLSLRGANNSFICIHLCTKHKTQDYIQACTGFATIMLTFLYKWCLQNSWFGQLLETLGSAHCFFCETEGIYECWTVLEKTSKKVNEDDWLFNLYIEMYKLLWQTLYLVNFKEWFTCSKKICKSIVVL